jgi:very-short-patch-repair endonuclease
VTFAQRNQRPTEPPEAAVRTVAADQYGVFTWTQALEAGLSAAAITRRVTSGLWERLLPRVYRVTGGPSNDRQAALAACLWAGRGVVVSHRTAAALWELDGVEARKTEITVQSPRDPRSRLVVVHRTIELPSADRTTRHGIPITTATRTILDLAGCASGEAVEAALESALRRGLVHESVLRGRIRGRRSGGGVLRQILDRRGHDAALESRLEVKVWRLIIRSGLPKPVRQHPVEIEGRRYRLDFAWPSFRIAVEADGFATHGRRRSFIADRRRMAMLASRGWRIIPVTWEDATARPDAWLAGLGRTFALAS